MIGTAEKRAQRGDEKRRRREVLQRLADFGLARGPRRLAGDPGAPDFDESRVSRLCAALESLGPVFSAFGLYMATRVDLMRARDCLELATIPDRLEPSSPDAVTELLSAELGCPAEECFAEFEEEPFESRILHQAHRATLHDGQAVVVRLARTELREHFARDAELLPLLSCAFPLGEIGPAAVVDAATDFRRSLLRHGFSHQADALACLGRDAEEFETLKTPKVYRELSSANVLTVERVSARWLGEIVAAAGCGGAVFSSSEVDGRSGTYDLAYKLCHVWLRQAMSGRTFPVEPRAEDVGVTPSVALCFSGGSFATLPSPLRDNLWGYLAAAVCGDSDRACTYLLAAHDSDGRREGEEELRHRLRQIVPFRDGGWGDTGSGESLAEHLFLHWRVANELGFRAQPHLRSFYRGLFLTVASAHALAPGRDPLLDALGDVRIMVGVEQLRERMGFGRLGESAERYAALMLGLPQRMDEVLTMASEGRTPLKVQLAQDREERRRDNSSSMVTAMLAGMAALALLAHQVSASGVAGAWVEKVGAALFLLFGVLLLRTARRAR